MECTPRHSYGTSLAIWDHTVLPATLHKWTHPALTPARQACTRLTYPGRMEGWVDLGDLLHTKMYEIPQAVTHPSNNRAQCRLTTLIETNMLTTTLCRHLLNCAKFHPHPINVLWIGNCWTLLHRHQADASCAQTRWQHFYVKWRQATDAALQCRSLKHELKKCDLSLRLKECKLSASRTAELANCSTRLALPQRKLCCQISSRTWNRVVGAGGQVEPIACRTGVQNRSGSLGTDVCGL